MELGARKVAPEGIVPPTHPSSLKKGQGAVLFGGFYGGFIT